MTDNGVKSQSIASSNAKPKSKESFRVFLKKRNPDKTIDPHSGRVIVVHPGTTLESLQKKIGDKYEFQVGDLFMDHHGQLLQIDDIDEIQEGDTIVASGIKLHDKTADSKDQEDAQGLLSRHSNSTETAITKASDASDIKDTLLKLTNQLSRLITRLDERNNALDGLARQLSKNSEQSMKQYSEILQALAARPISPAPINVPEAPIVQRPHAVSKAPRPVTNTQNTFTKIWDLTTFKLLKTLEGHTGIVHCLALNKGKHLISGSDDKSIRVVKLHKLA